MFPSTNYTSSSPYPCFPSSSSSLYPPFTFLNLENASANNTFHHIHDPVLSVPYIPTTTPHHHHAAIPETLTNWAVSDCSASMLKQDLSVSHYGISNFLTKKPAKKAVKKDRHSKIHTSQGLRDRRVRLSIDIARKFFDLQDMLGFDKASNTLDWLFTKSKKAIEELTRSKSTSNNDNDNDDDTVSSSEGEVVSLINNQQKVMDPNKERKLKRAKMKEPKGKERTRIVEEEEEQERYPENPQTLHQLMRSSPFHSQLVGSELPRNDDHEDDDEFNVIEESIVIKRKKVKQSSISSSSHHHQNIVIPKETSFNNSDSNNSFPMSPNWDANGRSNFCAIATMNLSTGLQIFGKSWEECTSPHLY